MTGAAVVILAVPAPTPRERAERFATGCPEPLAKLRKPPPATVMLVMDDGVARPPLKFNAAPLATLALVLPVGLL